ncbi:MAG: hypothetical protein H8D45_20065 [Bacteroidetes bacterium]|nr:hypothetical protein [Bacteroidota bacterium]
MTKEIWKNIGYGTIITLVIGAAYFIVITYNDVNKLFNYNLPLLNAEHDEFRNSISSLKAEFESKFDNERTKEDEFMLINKAYEDIELSKRNFDRIEIKINDQIIPSLNFLLESNKNTLFLIQKLNLIGDLSDSIRRLNFFIDSLVAELNKSMKSKNDTNEQYPKNMLKEISDIIPAQELAVQETYNDLIAEADAFF